MLFQADRPTQSVLVADLDSAGIVQSFCNEGFCDLRWLATGFEIDGFGNHRGTLAFVGFRETGYSSAERGEGSGFIVAVQSAESGSRDEEGARGGNVLVQGAHGRVKRLDANTNCVAPGVDIHGAEIAFDIEGRQPVNSVHRGGDDPGLDEFILSFWR